MDLLPDNLDLIEQCLDMDSDDLLKASTGGGNYDYTLLEELIAADDNDGNISSESSSDSGNYSPSSSSSGSAGKELFHQHHTPDFAASSAADCFASLGDYADPYVQQHFDRDGHHPNPGFAAMPGNNINGCNTYSNHNTPAVVQHPWENSRGFEDDDHRHDTKVPRFDHQQHPIPTSYSIPENHKMVSPGAGNRCLLRVDGSERAAAPQTYHVPTTAVTTDKKPKPVVMMQIHGSGNRPQSVTPVIYCQQSPQQTHSDVITTKAVLLPTSAATSLQLRSQPYQLKRPAMIKIQNPHQPQAAVFASPSTPLICATPTLKSATTADMDDYDDDYVRKKEDRKLRNRASAQLSRQRKREEQDRMRVELEEARTRCDTLEAENRQLKQRVAQLQTELTKIKSPQENGGNNAANISRPATATTTTTKTMNAAKVAGVCMMLLCVMMVPNYNDIILRVGNGIDGSGGTAIDFPISNMANNNNVDKFSHPVDEHNGDRRHHHGRSLGTIEVAKQSDHQQIAEVDDVELLGSDGFNATSRNRSTEMVVAGPGCADPMATFMNSSQSIKLTEDLSRWISRHEQTEWVQLRRAKLPSLFSANRPPLSKVWVSDESFGNEVLVKNGAEAQQRSSGQMKTRRGGNKRNNNSKQQNQSASASLSPHPLSLRGDLVRRLLNKRGAGGRLPNKAPQMVELVEGIKEGDAGADNTLYILALRDYWLMPPGNNSNHGATQHNSSYNVLNNVTNTTAGDGRKGAHQHYRKMVVPKLSIILPALSPPLDANDQTRSGQQRLSMMRIECEVVATSVFYLNEELVKSLAGDSATRWPHSYDDILFR